MTETPRKSLAPGQLIEKCRVPGTFALGFDDGTLYYTEQIVELLAQRNAKATFFATTRAVSEWSSVGRRDHGATPLVSHMVHLGHQIAVQEKWHDNSDGVTTPEEQTRLEVALKGFSRPDIPEELIPTYMRPPVGHCTVESGCQERLIAQGFRVVPWDFDFYDWKLGGPGEMQAAKDRFAERMEHVEPGQDSLLFMVHDTDPQTAVNFTSYALDLINAKGFVPVTVGDCIGESVDMWYQRVPQAPASQVFKLPAQWTLGHQTKHGLPMFLALLMMAALSLGWALQKYASLRLVKKMQRTTSSGIQGVGALAQHQFQEAKVVGASSEDYKPAKSISTVIPTGVYIAITRMYLP